MADKPKHTPGHTPGPWNISRLRTLLHIQGYSEVCTISISANHVHEDFAGAKAQYIERQKANARMISAAPDMYAALEKMRGILRDLQPAMNIMAREVMDDIIKDQIDPALSKATNR